MRPNIAIFTLLLLGAFSSFAVERTGTRATTVCQFGQRAITLNIDLLQKSATLVDSLKAADAQPASLQVVSHNVTVRGATPTIPISDFNLNRPGISTLVLWGEDGLLKDISFLLTYEGDPFELGRAPEEQRSFAAFATLIEFPEDTLYTAQSTVVSTTSTCSELKIIP